jgi:hypothetical protein
MGAEQIGDGSELVPHHRRVVHDVMASNLSHLSLLFLLPSFFCFHLHHLSLSLSPLNQTSSPTTTRREGVLWLSYVWCDGGSWHFFLLVSSKRGVLGDLLVFLGAVDTTHRWLTSSLCGLATGQQDRTQFTLIALWNVWNDRGRVVIATSLVKQKHSPSSGSNYREC